MIRMIIKYAIVVSLYVIASFAIILFFAEHVEGLSFILLLLTKIMAVIALCGVWYLSHWLNDHNLIPKRVVSFIEKLTEEE